MNWMLPLETLPGWPEAPDVSAAHMLFLMFLGPLAFGAVIVLIAFTPALGRRFRGELHDDHAPEGEYVALEHEAKAQRAAIEPEVSHDAALEEQVPSRRGAGVQPVSAHAAADHAAATRVAEDEPAPARGATAVTP